MFEPLPAEDLMMGWNWDDVRFFLAVCRKQSFVAAAAELRVTHSTVARRISSLEEALQTQLVYRTEKGCRLTPEGETLLPYAEQLETTVINLEGHVSGLDRRLTGAIRIGSPDGLGNYFLASCLGEFQSANPGVEVELVAAPMYYSLAKREIDILITIRRPTVGNVVSRLLTRYRLGLFAHPEYLQRRPGVEKAADLKQHLIISYIDDLLFDEELQFMEEICPGLEGSFRCSSVVAQLHGAAGGAGIGVIPYFMARKEPSLVQVLPELSIERQYWLQVNPDTRQLARVRAAIDFIADYTRAKQNIFQSVTGN